MYVFDDFSDILQYAFFKKELDEPYFVNSDDEDFDMSIGNFTPKHFPRKYLGYFRAPLRNLIRIV